MRDTFSKFLRRSAYGFATLFFFSAFWGLAASTAQADTSWYDSVGYTELVAKITAAGGTVPTGSGVSVMQVEASTSDSSTIVSPDTSLSEFSGKTFTFLGSAGSSNVSSHATTVAGYFYGDSSLSQGITKISIDDANSWLNTYVAGQASVSADVVNCSWVGTTNSTSSDVSLLQALDKSINTNDYVCVVAVSANSTGGSPATLLGQAYNTITVGVVSGNDSTGSTTIYGTGRTKPDLVVDASATSWATPMVSSASALLISTANGLSTGSSDGKHSQTIKAILMAGATKSTLSSWSHTTTSPLDSTYGAGELNVLRSYEIMTGGEQKAGSTITSAGWDYNSLTSSSVKKYYFSVASGNALSELSTTLTWNAQVTGIGSYTTTLANLDLYLYKVGSDGSYTLVDESVSTADNVELLYETLLASGNYVLEVISASSTSTNYALAWYMTSEAVPEPGTLLLLASAGVAGAVFFRRRCRR